MPGFTPSNGDLLEVVICCNTTSQIALNVLHVQMVTQGAVQMSLVDIANALDAVFAPLYKPLMSSLATYRGLSVRNMMSPRTISFPVISNTGIGTNTASLAPTQTSYIIKLRGYLAGRKFVGHLYPGFPDATSVVSAGGMLGATYVALQALASRITALANISSGVPSAVIQPVIRNKDVIVGGVKVPQWSTVQVAIGIQKWATQRRRGQFGKTNSVPF